MFTKHRIVSVASLETGIVGALQHSVLFICHESATRTMGTDANHLLEELHVEFLKGGR